MAAFSFTLFLTTSSSTGTVLHVVNAEGTGTRCGSSASIKADHRVGALMCRKCADQRTTLLFPPNYPFRAALHSAISVLSSLDEDRQAADALRQAGVVYAQGYATDGQIIAEAMRRSAGRVPQRVFQTALAIGYRRNA